MPRKRQMRSTRKFSFFFGSEKLNLYVHFALIGPISRSATYSLQIKPNKTVSTNPLNPFDSIDSSITPKWDSSPSEFDYIPFVSNRNLWMARNKPTAGIEIKVHSRHGEHEVQPAAARSRPSGTSPTEFGQYRPFKKWVPWLVPVFVVANSVMFTISMYVNDCPKNSASCVGRFLGRFSFQPLKENPLLGPSSSTWVSFFFYWVFVGLICCLITIV